MSSNDEGDGRTTTTNAGDTTGNSTTTAKGGSGGYGSLSMWKKQLITKEDPMHIHKTIGILCIVSYIFRIVHIGSITDMGFVTYPSLTIPTIILHLLLNTTSFIFHIPNKRISTGYRIWPEYRLHSFVFLFRSLAVMTLYWYEQTYYHHSSNQLPNYDMNLVIIIGSMILADYSSYTQKQYQSSTIRDLDTQEWVKYVFSVAQFCGTTNILYGLRYRYSFHMLSVIVIQCNAFLMTIRRKNLVNQSVLVSIYGITLLVSMIVSLYEYQRVDIKIVLITSIIVHLSVVQRMVPTIVYPYNNTIAQMISNKYVVWMTVGLLLRTTRNYLHTIASLYDIQLLYVITAIPFFILGWYKCCYYQPRNSSSNTTTTTTTTTAAAIIKKLE